MTDEPAAELPKGTPGRRALGAMETAARRAREASGAAATLTPLRRPDPPAPAQRTVERVADRAPDRRLDRWLVAAVAVVAVLVIAAGIALAVSPGTSPQTAVPPPTATVGTHAGTVPPAQSGGRNGRTTPTSATPPAAGKSNSTSTTTSVPSTPGAAPAISSITPARGTAGQEIAIAGANFLSSDGRIVATFNGQVAATTCPAQNSCTVTVPPPTPGSESAQVAITTASGTSNAVTFNYG